MERQDAKRLPYPSHSFAAVISNSIVHHIPEPGKVLAEMVRQGKRMSALARQFQPVPQKLENVRFNGGKPLESAAVIFLWLSNAPG